MVTRKAQCWNVTNCGYGDFPCGPAVKNRSMQGMQVRYLFRELRSHMPQGDWACMLHQRSHMPQLRPDAAKEINTYFKTIAVTSGLTTATEIPKLWVSQTWLWDTWKHLPLIRLTQPRTRCFCTWCCKCLLEIQTKTLLQLNKKNQTT